MVPQRPDATPLMNRGLDVGPFPALLGPELAATEPHFLDPTLDPGNDLDLALAAWSASPILRADMDGANRFFGVLTRDSFLEAYERAGPCESLGRADEIYLLVFGHVAQVTEDGPTGRIEHLFGPGCFVGLEQAWAAWCRRRGDAEVPAPPALRCHALPLPGVRLGAREALQAAFADFRAARQAVGFFRMSHDDLMGHLEETPVLQRWLEHAVALQWRRRGELDGLIEGHPLLCTLDEPARNLLLQTGVLVRPQVRPRASGPAVPEPTIGRGIPPTRCMLLLEGTAKVDGEVAGTVQTRALEGPGTLLGQRWLRFVGGVEGAPTAKGLQTDEDLWLSPGAEAVLWDLGLLRRLMRQRVSPWLALRAGLSPGPLVVDRVRGRVTVVIGGQADGSDPRAEAAVSPLALGLAAALRRRALEEGGRAQDVYFVDPGGAEALGRDLGEEVVATVLDQDIRGLGDFAPGMRVEETLACHRLRSQGAHGPALSAVEVVSARVESATFELASTLAALGNVADLVLVLRRDPADPLAVIRTLEHLQREPTSVVWLTSRPQDEWTHTAQAPRRLIRVDLVDDRWRELARSESREVAHDTEEELHGRHGPRTPAWHVARLVDRGDDHGGLSSGGLVGKGLAGGALGPSPGTRAEGAAARTCWRLARMLRGESVGLALSGGGVWGFAHVGLVDALEEAGLPVDYVSGTSFGSVVAALYAGGGRGALAAFVDQNKTPRLPTSLLRAVGGLATSSFTRAALQSIPVSTAPLARMVDRVLTEPGEEPLLLDETEVPFLPVGSDLSTHEVATARWRRLSFGVRLASGLAPVFPGLRLKGQKVVDGAILSNVPAEKLRRHNADFVVAANVIGAPFARVIEGGPLRRLAWRAWDATGQRPIDAWTSLWLVLWKASVDQGRLHADALLDCGVEDVNLFAGYVAPQLREATRAQLADSGFVVGVMEQYRRPAAERELLETKIFVRP